MIRARWRAGGGTGSAEIKVLLLGDGRVEMNGNMIILCRAWDKFRRRVYASSTMLK
jgi:hypothetical protein